MHKFVDTPQILGAFMVAAGLAVFVAKVLLPKREKPEEQPEPRYCRNCRWQRGQGVNSYCTRAEVLAQRSTSLVTGDVDLAWCDNARFRGKACGPEGLFYEPKQSSTQEVVL